MKTVEYKYKVNYLKCKCNIFISLTFIFLTWKFLPCLRASVIECFCEITKCGKTIFLETYLRIEFCTKKAM